MGILRKKKIIEYLDNGQLIKDARKIDGKFDVEAASYDLAIGTAVIKKDGKRIFQKRTQQYVYHPEKIKQETVTLGPGQMIFTITHEEIMMPENLCGTVYSRNSLAQRGILALNAGHIDPGFHGPITIKLINLRSIDYTLKMGDPIFTIVFHEVIKDEKDMDVNQRIITKEDTLKRVLDATDLSLNNALYDLALLREFVKENEFGRALRKWLFKTFWGIVVFILGIMVTIITVSGNMVKIYEHFYPTPTTTQKATPTASQPGVPSGSSSQQNGGLPNDQHVK
jgi:deoxycytidine triphosphate deaminase